MGALTGRVPLLAPGTFTIAAAISLAFYASVKLATATDAPEARIGEQRPVVARGMADAAPQPSRASSASS